MSMNDSTELGWLIRNKDSDEYVGPLFENAEEDENGFFIPGTEDHPDATHPDFLYIETHPHNPKMVFVSWVDPEHGFPLDGTERHRFGTRGLSVLVRDFIKTLDPEAVVDFAVIVTRR